MEGIVDILAILLAAVAQAFLQLGVGTLLLLYHESMRQNVRKKTRRVTRGFILGVGIFTILLISLAALVILSFMHGPLGNAGLTTVISILILEGILAMLFYYRPGKNTMLWIPDFIAKYLTNRAKRTESGVEGMAIGMTTALGEVLFSAILMFTAANSMLELPLAFLFLAIAGYTLITLMPMISMKVLIRNGKNVAEIQRWRVKNKNFLRIFTGVCYLILAGFLIAFKVMR